jgi:hypothetical protein
MVKATEDHESKQDMNRIVWPIVTILYAGELVLSGFRSVRLGMSKKSGCCSLVVNAYNSGRGGRDISVFTYI